MAEQTVPNALQVNTATYPLFVPQDVHESDDADGVFMFLVTAWVFTAWLRKRFPEADIKDCAMLAGMAAWRPTSQLITMMELSNLRFPGHPKAAQNLAMLRVLDQDFTLKREATAEEFEEAKAYNDKAVEEVEALFPCVCGQCEDHPSRAN